MGGLITTAARLKDGKVVSFRGYTNNDFNLELNQNNFIKKNEINIFRYKNKSEKKIYEIKFSTDKKQI